MSADQDLLDADLYGDLDDLDATRLDEELIDPDAEPEGSFASPQAQATTSAAIAATAPPVAGPSATNQAGPSSAQGQQVQGQAGVGSNAGGDEQGELSGMDRIRPSDMPDEGKMFIGGLNWETTDEGLKEYMEQYGEVDACTIMRDPTGRSRGFAFLTYKSAESVTKVMGLTHHLNGKQIDPKRAIPRAEHERTAKVFVGGLAAGVTSESLKEFLGQFGMVMDATVMYDRATDRSKGFAFATFADEEAVGRAMAASGIELEGKPIEIKKAQPKGSGNLPKNFGNAQGGGGRFNQQGQQNGGFGGNMGGGGGNAGSFDPMAMAMMYQNMMKGAGMNNMGGMGGGFDPNSMAMMYQNMMKNMGGMGNAPAINPNMASNMMRNNMGGMGGMGNMMGGMGGMGMGMGMNGMGGMGMNNMGNMGGMGGGYNNNQMMNRQPMGGASGNVPNAPRGPAAMRSGGGPSGGAGGSPAGQGGAQGGPGAQRYSTQGSQRSRPY